MPIFYPPGSFPAGTVLRFGDSSVTVTPSATELTVSGGKFAVLGGLKTDLHNDTPYDTDTLAAADGVELGEVYSNGGFLVARST